VAKIEKLLFFGGGLRNEYAPQTLENVREAPGRPTGKIWLRRVEEFSFCGLAPKPEVVDFWGLRK